MVERENYLLRAHERERKNNEEKREKRMHEGERRREGS